ncbi:EAL domain-containing protein [Shewanella waksmanii]|uniref:EAL domain-containing protein n=1 Tax=Shewanella waksmanii TaxID=213783 RepID=UPI00049042BF|nr:EAL domain-containing protein [Shewanella waksmanii]
MSVSKSFHLVLLTVFALIATAGLFVEKKQLHQFGEQQLAQYQQSSQLKTMDAANGKAFYRQLAAEYDLQFFQYIHTDDNELSYTHGSLDKQGNVITSWLNIDLDDTRTYPGGRLQVRLDTSQLIDAALNDFISWLLALIAAYVILAIIFSLMMRKQAVSIGYAASYIQNLSEHKYTALEQSKLGGQFKPLAQALDNSRAQFAQTTANYEKELVALNKEAYQDPITGLGTRQKFTEHLDTITNGKNSRIGILAIIKATELGSINQSQGRAAGDNYLAKIAEIISDCAVKYEHAQCYRISTGDFGVIISDITLKDSQQFLAAIKTHFNEYQQTINADSIGHTGLVPYQQGTEAVPLLTLADAAVSIAQTLGPNSFHIQEKLNGDELYGDTRWQEAIEDLIQRRALKFYVQPISPCRSEVQVYKELLARFYNSEGKFLPTATVIAMAERHGKSIELDKLVILSTIKMLLEDPSIEGAFGINISSASAMQPSFVAWLKDILGRQRHIAARLVFEVNEAGLQTNFKAAHSLVHEIHSVGSRVSVEHFGMGLTSFKFFKQVRPDFVKLDRSYAESIDVDTNNRFFVKMMIDIARRLAIRVIACGVERQEEKLALERLLVDGLQGYYIAQPQAFRNKGGETASN